MPTVFKGQQRRMNSWSGEYEGEMGEGVRVTGNPIVGAVSITKNLAYVTHTALEIFKPGCLKFAKDLFGMEDVDQRQSDFLACAKPCVQPSAPKRKSRGGKDRRGQKNSFWELC